MGLWIIGLALVAGATPPSAAGDRAKTSLWTPETLKWAIANPDLEALGPTGEGFVGWEHRDQGFAVDAREHHSGRFSARCRNASDRDERGIGAILPLNQQAPAPVIVEGWSKAEDVSCGPDTGYVLHVGITYADGVQQYPQRARFAPGTHGWQKGTVVFVPEKPIRDVGVAGFLSKGTGTAWFDDLQLWSLDLPANTTYFDGIPVQGQPPAAPVSATGPSLSTDDGLTLQFDAATGQPRTFAPGGFFLRDAEALSHFWRPGGRLEPRPDGSLQFEGEEDQLKLHLSATYRSVGSALRVDATVTDLTGDDRAITAYFVYPVDATGWDWHDDMRASRRITGQGSYHNCRRGAPGVNGLASKYPFACLTQQGRGLVLGAPMDAPRLYRFGYNADSHELYAAVDLGVSPQTAAFPSRADFSLVLFGCDPRWGFRSALQRYYDLFPHLFARRCEKGGLWLGGGCGDPIDVEGIEDFGIAYQTNGDDVAFCEEAGVYSLTYTEPMSLWEWMPEGTPRTYLHAQAHVETLAQQGNLACLAAPQSAVQDENGVWRGGPADIPWCKGYFFSMNPAPGLIAAMEGKPTQAERCFLAVDHSISQAQNLVPGWVNGSPPGSLTQLGYVRLPGAGRDGSAALQLRHEAGQEDAAAVQRLVLNQDRPRTLTARVWTHPQGVTGANDDRYCLHAWADFADGTSAGLLWVWAQAGIEEWQCLEKTITPPKAVKALTVRLVFAAPHTGAALFDDAYLGQEGDGGNLLENHDFEVPPGKFAADGAFVDSLPMSWGQLNYRADHLRATDSPLVFDRQARVCQWMVFPTVEYVRELAARLRAQGKLALGNGVPFELPWAAPWIDIMGHEVHWASDRGFTPDPCDLMCYQRALSYQKPFAFLAHFDTSDFPPQHIEAMLKAGVAYGFFPTPGAALGGTEERRGNGYWVHPEWYNRDRPLFRKYMPVIQALDAAGWQPITLALSGNPAIYVERFGRPGGPLYLTVFNDSDQPQEAGLQLDLAALGLAPGGVRVAEVLGGEAIAIEGAGYLRTSVRPHDVKVLQLDG